MFFDIINDAIAKAKTELEKSVDNALGIDSTKLTPGEEAPSGGSHNVQSGALNGWESADTTKLPGNGVESQGQVPQPPATHAVQPDLPAVDAPAPPTTKKVIRKVIKKVPKGTLTGKAAAATSPAPAAAQEAACAPSTSTQPALQPSDSNGPEDSTSTGPAQPAAAAADVGPAAADPSLLVSHTPDTHDPGDANPHVDSTFDAIPQAPSSQPNPEPGSHPDSHQQPAAHTGQQHDHTTSTTASRSSRPASEPDTSGTADASSLHAHTGNNHTSPQLPTATSAAPADGPSLALAPSVDVPDALQVPTEDQLQQLSSPALITLVQELQCAVSSRDQQLVRAAQVNSQLQGVVAGLQVKNEELALKSSKISEQDWEEIQREFEQRLAVAERKVYALTKERDALKRGNEKLSDYGALVKEKDGVIKQVMEEGQRLAAKQGDMEATLKKLRAQIKELEADKERLSGKLSAEEAAHEAMRKSKVKLERDLQEAQEAAAAELQAAKLQADSLLLKARNDQAEAEERARDAANAGLAKKLREAESRAEAMSDTVVELREALDRQRQAAALREEMLKQDIADLERQCQAAEMRHQELASKLPDATRPLLRQIEAMQAAASAQSEAWAAAEESLTSRIEESEARAAASGERERHAVERAQLLQTRLSGVEAALGAARIELKSLGEQLDAALQAQAQLRDQVQEAQQAARMEAEHSRLAKQHLQQAEEKHSNALALEHAARLAAEADAATLRKEFERRTAELESQLQELSPASRGVSAAGDGGNRGDAPAMAAPGYKWVLVKEGESAPQQSISQAGVDPEVAARARRNSRASIAQEQQHQQAGQQQQAAAGDGAADFWSGLVPSGSSSMPLASELESMRATLRIRCGEVASLEVQVRQLELTRDRLSEELVAAAQKAEEASTALATIDTLRKELDDVKTRYGAAVELLGERDEALEELRADLMDVKNMYRDQIDFMVEQLTRQGHVQPAQIVLDASQQQHMHTHKD